MFSCQCAEDKAGGAEQLILLSNEFLKSTLKTPLLFQLWDVWYSPYAKPLFPFLFFARIMSTLFILTVPTTRRMTAVPHHPRLCLTEPARCPAAGRIQSVRDTSVAATMGASTPAWSPYSHRQVESNW